MVVVWHDNGSGCGWKDGGFTEYTTEEITKIGNIDKLLKWYANGGIKVFRIDFMEGN